MECTRPQTNSITMSSGLHRKDTQNYDSSSLIDPPSGHWIWESKGWQAWNYQMSLSFQLSLVPTADIAYSNFCSFCCPSVLLPRPGLEHCLRVPLSLEVRLCDSFSSRIPYVTLRVYQPSSSSKTCSNPLNTAVAPLILMQSFCNLHI